MDYLERIKHQADDYNQWCNLVEHGTETLVSIQYSDFLEQW
jgi:hypothetical protein